MGSCTLVSDLKEQELLFRLVGEALTLQNSLTEFPGSSGSKRSVFHIIHLLN